MFIVWFPGSGPLIKRIRFDVAGFLAVADNPGDVRPRGDNPRPRRVGLQQILGRIGMKFFLLIAFLFFCSQSAWGTSDIKTIKQSDYGEKWPLTVPEATLLCKGWGGVYVYVNERYYPVNGLAGSQQIIDTYIGEPIYDLQDIWASDPVSKYGLRISIGPLIDDGLKLCK